MQQKYFLLYKFREVTVMIMIYVMENNSKQPGIVAWVQSSFSAAKKARGATQKQLGEALSISQPQARKIITGERPVKVDELPILEDFFGTKFIPSEDSRVSYEALEGGSIAKRAMELARQFEARRGAPLGEDELFEVFFEFYQRLDTSA